MAGNRIKSTPVFALYEMAKTELDWSLQPLCSKISALCTNRPAVQQFSKPQFSKTWSLSKPACFITENGFVKASLYN